MKATQESSVKVGEGVVTVKRSGSSSTVIANILGSTVEDRVETLYLDRLVHNAGENDLGDFKVHGAISSILVRPVSHS